jgi:malonyl CoA-acyl carrier protein transacylase
MTVFLFPGQGSQKVGMGGTLFSEFPELTAQADAILGYSIADLCLKDSNGELGKTQFTQPALYVVNALTYLKKLKENGGAKPNYVAGHSLGEYSALFAAEAFDFETGLRLVQKRGALMASATGGGMAAIIGKSGQEVADILKKHQLDTIDIANLNSLKQVVISGLKADIDRSKASFESEGCMFFPLNVSGAFHSKLMTPSRDEFEKFVDQFNLSAPNIPVIANYTGKPYEATQVKTNLVEQINHQVRWTDSILHLINLGEQEFVEIGPGAVLTALVAKIKKGQ